MLENNRVELKRELNDRLERTVVSFMNYPGGGEIIIGVDDTGKAVCIYLSRVEKDFYTYQ